MVRYKGYYIDGVTFKSMADIDEFRKKEIISGIRKLAQRFNSGRYSGTEMMALSMEIYEREKELHDEFGVAWEEIEKLEIGC